jgi:hypothetical protein
VTRVQPVAETEPAGQERMDVAVRVIAQKPVVEMAHATHWKKGAPLVRQTVVFARGIAVLPIPLLVVNKHPSRTVCAPLIHPVAQEIGPRPALIWRMAAEVVLEIVALPTALPVVLIPHLRIVYAGTISSAVRLHGTWIARRSHLKVALAVAEMGYVQITRTRVLVPLIALEIVVEMESVIPLNPAQPVMLTVVLVREVAASPMTRRVVTTRPSQHAFVHRISSVATFPGEFNALHTLTCVEVAQEIAVRLTWDQAATMKPSNCASVKWMTSAVMSSGMMCVSPSLKKIAGYAPTRSHFLPEVRDMNAWPWAPPPWSPSLFFGSLQSSLKSVGLIPSLLGWKRDLVHPGAPLHTAMAWGRWGRRSLPRKETG